MDFVNDHNELYDKASKHFKDKARCFSGRSSPRFANFLQRYERHKSGQEMTESPAWTQDKSGFLRSHIKSKGLSKLSAFTSLARGVSDSTTTAHNVSRVLTDTDSIEINMRSTDIVLQPLQVMSPTAASRHSSVDQQVMDKFTQMRSMLSSFLG